MNALDFEKKLLDIRTLNDTEGPHTNIFANKFKAREEMLEVRRVLKDTMVSEPSVATQLQLGEIYLMLGNNMFETEEEEEALEMMLRAFRIVQLSRTHGDGSEYYDFKEEPKWDLEDMLGNTRALAVPDAESASESDFTHVDLYLDVLNAIAIVLSNRDKKRRIEDALVVLHHTEAFYLSWDRWAKAHGLPTDVVGDEFGNVPLDEAPEKKLRARVEKAYTTTVFYLAQAYGAQANTPKASMYCHYTLARQLISRKEFSHKDWATNALHLSGFYMGEDDFASAMYFVDAAKIMAPTEERPGASSKDEINELAANVHMALGRFYRYVLRRSVEELEGHNVGPTPDRAKIASWWVDLPLEGLAKKPPVQLATTFDAARELFKNALSNFKACTETYYIFDGFCTDYIQIQFDIADLYKLLIAFETDTERVCLMHQRRADALEPLPDKLNPQSYLTHIQKMWFELGEIYSDIVDVRVDQRTKCKEKGEKGPSDRKVNDLVAKSKAYFVKFVDSFNARETGRLPKDFDKDLHATYIRALMRVARMETKCFAANPKAEYDNIQRALERYESILKFVDDFKVRNPDVEHEVSMCREMVVLLPGKMKDVWRAYNKMCS
eukprot:PhM_4_TR6830/c0_g1_i1/m.79800